MNTAVSSALSPALDAQAAPATPTPIPTALPASSLAPAPAAPRRSFALPARLQSLKRLPPTLALARQARPPLLLQAQARSLSQRLGAPAQA